MISTETERRFNKVFDKLVPHSGVCDTLGGEIMRAVARIVARYYNDGDVAWYGYGRETVNPALRFLGHVCECENLTEEFADIVDQLFDDISEEKYEDLIDALVEATTDMVDFCQLGERVNVYGNMLDYADPKEDRDVDEEDDFDYDEWEREKFGSYAYDEE